jgi:predicted nucleic acid-binding Zn ribbon protein
VPEERKPESLSEILSRLFLARGWGRRQDRLRLEEAWRQSAGEQIAGATQLGSLRCGTLEVVVGNPVLLQELASFRKRQLLQALQERIGTQRITDLRFRLGTVE